MMRNKLKEEVNYIVFKLKQQNAVLTKEDKQKIRNRIEEISDTIEFLKNEAEFIGSALKK